MTDPETANGQEPESVADQAPDEQAEDQGSELSDDAYKQAVSRLHRMSAPQTFATGVEDSIRRRSAGRFFGRKAFGDRVPFEVLAIIVLAIGLALFFLIRSSRTGSLRYEETPATPKISPGAKDVVPQPAPVDK